MTQYGSLFEDVGNQEDMGGFQPSLPVGNHVVALIKYGPKESRKQKGKVSLEAEFIVLESDSATPGAKHSEFWAINSSASEWAAPYARDRAKKFLVAARDSAGSDVEAGPFGVAMTDDFKSDAPSLRGLMMRVVTTVAVNGDGSTARYKRGGDVRNNTWEAIPDQDEGVLAATCAQLEELAKRPPTKAVASATTAPAVTSTRPTEKPVDTSPVAPVSPPAATSGLKSLLGKRK